MTLIWSVLIIQSAFARTQITMQADKAFRQGTYYKAIGLYKKAFVKERSSAEKSRILFRLGECHRHMANPELATQWYEKAVKAKYPDPIVFWHLGSMYKEQGAYPEAINYFGKYKDKTGETAQVELAISNCELAQEWMAKPERYDIFNEPLINSKWYDFSPTFSKGRGNNTVIFASGREGSTGSEPDAITGESFQDLYITVRDSKGKWSEPVPLGPEVNTTANEGAACLNAKRSMLFFTRCPLEKNANLGCDIYFATRSGRGWGAATLIPLKPEGADSISVGHPTLSKDDQVMVFASDLPGGQGGKDLWYSVYDKRQKVWTEPVNLGPHVNTPKDEMFPYIHENGSLYFSSNGHPGMGGLDMFVAAPDGFAEWKQPENLRYPMNSPAHDFGIVFDGEEERGYFTSNREGGKGQDDIYQFAKQKPWFTLTCIVRDLETQEPVANAEIHVVGSDQTDYKVKTNDAGEFEFMLMNETDRYIKEGQTYTIKAEKDSFWVGNDMISTIDLEESTHFYKEFLLRKVKPEAIEMPEVLYAFSKWELLVDPPLVNSKDSLDYLYNVMIENPDFVVELYSHTDTRGNKTFNRKLSQKRAVSCVEYLIEKGIAAERLIPVGKGEDQPLISDAEIRKMKTEEEREAAHQKNRRTEFSVVGTNYSTRTH